MIFCFLKFCIKKNESQTGVLANFLEWLDLDALKYKELNVYDKDKRQLFPSKWSINFSLYQEALAYAKKKSEKDNDLMKKISELRDQSKGQLNKLLSSPMQAKTYLDKDGNKLEVPPDSVQIVAGTMSKIKENMLTKIEKKKLLNYEKDLEELKALNNQLLDQMKEIMKDHQAKLKNDLIDQMKKIVEDLTVNK